jgi:hypothetical protein
VSHILCLNKDYLILFETGGGIFDEYFGGMIPLEGGKYFAIDNRNKITIIKPCCD